MNVQVMWYGKQTHADSFIQAQYLGPLSTPFAKVMADFFRHKNQHDALIQFAQFLVDLWSVVIF